MELFGIGGSELLLLLFLGGVLLGPRRLAQAARDLRRVINQVRALTTNLSEQLNREINLLEVEEVRAARPAVPEAPAGGALPDAYQRFREAFPQEGELGPPNGSAERAAPPGQPG